MVSASAGAAAAARAAARTWRRNALISDGFPDPLEHARREEFSKRVMGRLARRRVIEFRRRQGAKTMPNPAFVHLRLHSEYSVTDGIVRIDDAVARAAADGMPALAITDLANVFGAVKFYKAARAAGVKPVVGCDVWVSNESERDKPHRLLLLVQTHEGYLRLSQWL